MRTVWIEFLEKITLSIQNFHNLINREIYQTKTQNTHLNFIADINEFCVIKFISMKRINEVWIK